MIPRRRFLASLPAAALAARYSHAAGKPQPARALFGTLTTGKSKGIYIADWDSRTGKFGPLSLAAETHNPTFIASTPHPKGLLIAATAELDHSGFVKTFLLEHGSNTLKELSSQSTKGSSPTHLSIHPDGHSVFVANYGGGSVSSYHIRPDGTLSPIVSHFQYTGHGPNKERQEGPHAHSAQVTPGGRFVLVNDLGLDRIVVYRVNAATAELIPHEPEYWGAPADTGPRHIVFHPSQKWIYDINELNNTIITLAWNAKEGSMKSIQTVSTLPEGFDNAKASAGEIVIDKRGRFVYGNNRGHESIAAFAVAPGTGMLTRIGLFSNGGEKTRHITLSPDERFLIAANQTSGTVVVIPRNKVTGKLAAPTQTTPLDIAMFTLFI